MFRCAWSDSVTLRDLIDGVSDLVDTASFYVTSDHFRMEASDPSVICKIEVKAKKNVFSHYKTDSNSEFHLDMNLMKKIARRMQTDDEISITLEDKYLEFMIRNFVERYFRIPLLDFAESLPQISVDPLVSLRIRGDVFSSLMKDIAVVGSSFIIEAEPEEVTFYSEEDGVKSSVTVSKDNSALDKFTVKTACRSKFNLNYIESFLKTSKSVEYIDLFFGKKDTPLRMESVNGGLSLRFYLAPMEI